MKPQLYWMWMAQVLGLAAPRAGELCRQFGGARQLYEGARSSDLSALLAEVVPASALARMQTLEPADYAPMLARCDQKGVAVLTPEDADYPARLRELDDLPPVLYATGNTTCLNGGRYVGVVGTRRPTAYGVQACHEIARGLADSGVMIVSGLADGLDGEGHRAAVEAKKPTIGFLGTPIDRTYPAGNAALRREIEQKTGGTVLSEYAPGTAPADPKAAFLARNRLIAGMGEALCVAEARLRSGTMNTVGHAERYGRPVFAVPGSIFSPVSAGTNELLHAGRAHLLRQAEDVLECLGISAAEKAPAEEHAPQEEFSPDARVVLEQLGPKPQGVEELCDASGLPAPVVLAALTELEMAGAARAGAGRRYTAV